MSEMLDSLFPRRGQVRAYLGLTEEAMTKLIRSGVLKPKYFPGMKRAFFEREEVVKIKPGTLTTETQRHGEEKILSRQGGTTKGTKKA